MEKFKTFDIAEIPTNCPLAFYPCMIIVQASSHSQDQANKFMKEVNGRPLLAYLIERLRYVQHIEGIVVATSTSPIDDQVASFCKEHSLHSFRGSEDDVLQRFYMAAESFDLEVIVKINADSPLIDPKLIDKALFCMRSHYDELDYLSNTLQLTFPKGMEVEIFRFEALKQAVFHAKDVSARNEVTPFITAHPKKFRLGTIFQKEDQSGYHLALTAQEDVQLIKKVIQELYPIKPEFTLADVIRFVSASGVCVD